MKTPMHMSTGAEAICAGVCQALRPQDQVIGTYRTHGIYLAKTGETDRFFAEMYGRATGMAKGKAGSMHLTAPEAGLICTSAIVGTTIPVALGAAYANRQNAQDRVVAVFFGDGAIDEGVFWESINIACGCACRCCSSAKTTISRCTCPGRSATAIARLPTSSRASTAACSVRSRPMPK